MIKSLKIILVVVYCFLSLKLCNFVFAEEENSLEAERAAGQQMIDFNYAGYEDGGTKKWDVSAKTADIFTDVVNMKNITGKAYGEDDNMQLVADTGIYNKAVGSLHLQDNVIGTSDGGARLVTDSLDWDAKTGLITTDDQVDIKKDTMHTIGKGVVAHQKLKTIQLKKDVTVDMTREEQGSLRQTVITCDGPLDIDYNAQIAVFNDNVVATDDQGKMYADKMTVYFDTETKQIKKVLCTGNVKIDQEQGSAYGEAVTYNANDQKAQITGRPCLIFYSEKGGDGNASPFGN